MRYTLNALKVNCSGMLITLFVNRLPNDLKKNAKKNDTQKQNNKQITHIIK